MVIYVLIALTTWFYVRHFLFDILLLSTLTIPCSLEPMSNKHKSNKQCLRTAFLDVNQLGAGVATPVAPSARFSCPFALIIDVYFTAVWCSRYDVESVSCKKTPLLTTFLYKNWFCGVGWSPNSVQHPLVPCWFSVFVFSARGEPTIINLSTPPLRSSTTTDRRSLLPFPTSPLSAPVARTIHYPSSKYESN